MNTEISTKKIIVLSCVGFIIEPVLMALYPAWSIPIAPLLYNCAFLFALQGWAFWLPYTLGALNALVIAHSLYVPIIVHVITMLFTDTVRTIINMENKIAHILVLCFLQIVYTYMVHVSVGPSFIYIPYSGQEFFGILIVITGVLNYLYVR